jgi:hypothetical protein
MYTYSYSCCLLVEAFSVVFPAGSGNRLDHQSELGLPYNWDNRRSKLFFVFCIELFSSKTLYSTFEQQLHFMSLFFYIQLHSVPVLKGGKISNILLNFFVEGSHTYVIQLQMFITKLIGVLVTYCLIFLTEPGLGGVGLCLVEKHSVVSILQ